MLGPFSKIHTRSRMRERKSRLTDNESLLLNACLREYINKDHARSFLTALLSFSKKSNIHCPAAQYSCDSVVMMASS